MADGSCEKRRSRSGSGSFKSFLVTADIAWYETQTRQCSSSSALSVAHESKQTRGVSGTGSRGKPVVGRQEEEREFGPCMPIGQMQDQVCSIATRAEANAIKEVQHNQDVIMMVMVAGREQGSCCVHR